MEKADNYIESFLDNATFKNINEPVALFFSYVDTEFFEHLKNRRINILKEAKDNGNRAKTYFPVGLDLQNLLLENYHPQNATLDDVLIDNNVILKHYKSNTDFEASIKQMQQKVNQAKQIDNSKEIKQTAKVINTIENKGAVR